MLIDYAISARESARPFRVPASRRTMFITAPFHSSHLHSPELMRRPYSRLQRRHAISMPDRRHATPLRDTPCHIRHFIPAESECSPSLAAFSYECSAEFFA